MQLKPMLSKGQLRFFFLIYLFLALLGPRCCVQAFSSCCKRGPLFLWCAGFSLWWPLPLRSTGSRRSGFSSGSRALERRLSSCGTRAQLLRGMWDPPRPGLEPMSPTLAGGLPTTVPPGKP